MRGAVRFVRPDVSTRRRLWARLGVAPSAWMARSQVLATVFTVPRIRVKLPVRGHPGAHSTAEPIPIPPEALWAGPVVPGPGATEVVVGVLEG